MDPFTQKIMERAANRNNRLLGTNIATHEWINTNLSSNVKSLDHDLSETVSASISVDDSNSNLDSSRSSRSPLKVIFDSKSSNQEPIVDCESVHNVESNNSKLFSDTELAADSHQDRKSSLSRVSLKGRLAKLTSLYADEDVFTEEKKENMATNAPSMNVTVNREPTPDLRSSSPTRWKVRSPSPLRRMVQPSVRRSNAFLPNYAPRVSSETAPSDSSTSGTHTPHVAAHSVSPGADTQPSSEAGDTQHTKVRGSDSDTSVVATSGERGASQTVAVDKHLSDELEKEGFHLSESNSHLYYEFEKSADRQDAYKPRVVSAISKRLPKCFTNSAVSGNISQPNSQFSTTSSYSVRDKKRSVSPVRHTSPHRGPLVQQRSVIFSSADSRAVSKQQDVDPAELPLSERRKLFESGFAPKVIARFGSAVTPKMLSEHKAEMNNVKFEQKPAIHVEQTPATVVPTLPTKISDSSADVITAATTDNASRVSAADIPNTTSMESLNESLSFQPIISSSTIMSDTCSIHSSDTHDQCDETEEMDESSKSETKLFVQTDLDNNLPSLGAQIQHAANCIDSHFSLEPQSLATCAAIDDVLDIIDSPPKNAENSHFDHDNSMCKRAKLSEEQFRTPLVSAIKSPHTSSSRLPSTILDEQNYSEQPLMHSVSFYRRQKPQELDLTPVRLVSDDKSEVLSTKKKLVHSNTTQKIDHMHSEIEKQERVAQQALNALNVCDSNHQFCGSTEMIEAERVFLVATERKQALLCEMQRLRGVGNGDSSEDRSAMRGTLSLNSICIDLKPSFIRRVAASYSGHPSSNESIYHFICLLRYRNQVIATQILSSADSIQGGAITFPNMIKFSDLDSVFCVVLQIFGIEISHSNAKSYPKKDSKIRTPRKKGIPSTGLGETQQSSSSQRRSAFHLLGFLHLTIDNIREFSWDLDKVPFCSPLDGCVRAKVCLQSTCSHEQPVTATGFVTVFEEVGGLGSWQRRFAQLQYDRITMWRYPEQRSDPHCVPLTSVSLRRCTSRQAAQVARDVCARQNTVLLVTVRETRPDDRASLVTQVRADGLVHVRHLLSFDSKEERIEWCARINETLSGLRFWESDCVEKIEDV